MTEIPPASTTIAVVKPCEQYRYRVKLPGSVDRKIRMALYRRALREATDIYLECTKNYQSLAWVGAANLAFNDSGPTPSDSKTELLHLLLSLKIVELAQALYQENTPPDATLPFVVEVETPMPVMARRTLSDYCKKLGIEFRVDAEAIAKSGEKSRIGGGFRAPRHEKNHFSHQAVKRIENYRAIWARRLSKKRLLKRCVCSVLHGVALLAWPVPILMRALFSIYYRFAAGRVLAKIDGPRNVFFYFDLREGRNRDVGAYLRWKYDSEFIAAAEKDSSVIAFSHLARPFHAYSHTAMMWALQSLRRMRKDPRDGCVVVNYLIPPVLLLKLRFRRNKQRKRRRKQLRELQRHTDNFIARIVYGEFMNHLDRSNAFAMELSRSYRIFFEMLSPGVVIQADAVSKTARHFTACARRRGGRAIYVADRICTSLRTSNQIIADEGDNPHVPDRFVVFDHVTLDEFSRQGVPREKIYAYTRNFTVKPAVANSTEAGHSQVVIFLQAYEDNIGAMIHLGVEVAEALPKIHVLFQEHPSFPVADHAKAKVIAEALGRIRFLEPGGTVDYSRTAAMITGYSTAVVPGVLLGVPLIWMRRQVDNSVYGETYLERIGFATDSPREVISVLKRILKRDGQTKLEIAAANEAARAIFTPDSGLNRGGLKEVLEVALNDSFAEIHAPVPSAAASASTSLAAAEA